MDYNQKHCQDVDNCGDEDHCRYHLGIDPCQTGESTVRMEMSKGFDVLNRLMTGHCPSKLLQLRPKFHSLFLQNSFDFQKSATFKTLKSSPRMY